MLLEDAAGSERQKERGQKEGPRRVERAPRAAERRERADDEPRRSSRRAAASAAEWRRRRPRGAAESGFVHRENPKAASAAIADRRRASSAAWERRRRRRRRSPRPAPRRRWRGPVPPRRSPRRDPAPAPRLAPGGLPAFLATCRFIRAGSEGEPTRTGHRIPDALGSLCSLPVMRTGSAPRRRRVSLQLWVYRHRVVILATVGAVLLSGLAVLAHFTSVVVKRFDGHRWNLPSRIYSDMFVLRAGDAGSPEKLVGKARTALLPGRRRRARAGRATSAGQATSIEVFTAGLPLSGASSSADSRRAIEFASGKVASIRDALRRAAARPRRRAGAARLGLRRGARGPHARPPRGRCRSRSSTRSS